jgi:hypothetical protein
VAEKVARGAHSNGPGATISVQFIAGGAGGERLNGSSAFFIMPWLLFCCFIITANWQSSCIIVCKKVEDIFLD